MQEKYFDINESGYSVRCKLYGTGERTYKRVIVCGHGFGGHKDNHSVYHLAERILSKYKDIALLSFDFPCHGDDARKTLSLDECDEYYSLVIECAKRFFAAEDLYGYATSFGAYLLLLYIHLHNSPFKKVFLKSPAIPMYETLCRGILSEEDERKLKQGKPILAGFDRKVKIDSAFIEALKENDVRDYDFSSYLDDIMIVHGDKDEIVPFEGVRDFAENNFLYFVPIHGADHRYQDKNKTDEVIKELLSFFAL